MKRHATITIRCHSFLFLIVLTAMPYIGHSYEMKIEPKAPPLAKPFSLHDVRLLDGPFKQGQDTAAEYLLQLEPDRLLAGFRKEAGLEPKAESYKGWEARGIAGHSLGHYLSACALAWASTGDERFLERTKYIVSELAACQDATGSGYVAAIPNGKRIYAEIAEGNIRSSGFDLNGGWVPNYNLHKTFAGLRDAYRLCGLQMALDVEKKLADWFEQTHAKLSEDQMQSILACEHGGLNEVFADLYADTGDERYLALSKRIHHQTILTPLRDGKDILPGKHANTQIPKLIGLAERYELTGDEDDRITAEFFWDRVVNHHSYVTGGHCDHEHFGEPDKLNDRLSTDTTETCNVYNMLKLTKHVFGWKPEAPVADFYERALLNHIRSTQHPDGRVIYNLSLKPGHHKEYQKKFDDFTCCVNTGMETHVKYGECIYFHNQNSIWINLFISSEVQWKDKDVILRQETDFPLKDSSRITIQSKNPQQFTLRIRHPHWAVNGMNILVNGKEIDKSTKPSSYMEIAREWKSNDKIEISFPMSLRTEPMPDNSKRFAVFYGPTLLSADLGEVDSPSSNRIDQVALVMTNNKPLMDWLQLIDQDTLTFQTADVGRPDVQLVPFYSLHDRRYSVYMDRYSNQEWEKYEQQIKAEIERQKEMEQNTVNYFQPGEMQPERDHQLQSEKSSAGEAFGRHWRHAVEGGWFSFEMKVDQNQPMKLVCTYWGGDSGGRHFDILIDGEKVAEQRLQNNRPNQFYDEVYAIPESLIKGKDKVVVKLQAYPERMAGGLFGARMIKD